MRRQFSSLTLAIAVAALCCPTLKCFATTEPEITTAIRHKDFQRVRTLLSEGVNVNERDEGSEQTPLMWAVKVGDFNIVRSLIERGAALSTKDDMGRTALSIAQERHNSRIERLLIENGARPLAQRGAQRSRVASAR